MQTRKRAKSVSFGKPKKEVEQSPAENEEKKVVAAEVDTEEEVKTEAAHKHEKAAHDEKEENETPKEPTEAAKKVLDLEESEEPAKDDAFELSETPKNEKEEDFVTDKEPAKEASEEEKDEETSESEKSSGLSAIPEPTLSTPIIESETKTESAVVTPVSEADETEELSPTPPPSAFSLQEGGDGAGDSGDGKKRNFVVYFLVIALFSFILGIGAMAVLTSGFLPFKLPMTIPFLSQVQQQIQPAPTGVPTQAAKPTVAPTEKPLDLSAYTISVLNGSGIKGKAADVKTSLTTAGFKVSSTGNASSNDFTATEISAKKEVDEAYLDKLKEELGKEYKVEVAAAPAPASQTADVVVTLGKDTAE